MSEPRDIWQDRPVILGDFSLLEGEAIEAEFAVNQKNASYMLVVFSMRWADTGERVFQSVDEIWSGPYRHKFQLARLAQKAAYRNGLRDTEPDDGVVLPFPAVEEREQLPSP